MASEPRATVATRAHKRKASLARAGVALTIAKPLAVAAVAVAGSAAINALVRKFSSSSVPT